MSHTSLANFEFLSETSIKNMVFWEVAKCTYLVYKISRYFGVHATSIFKVKFILAMVELGNSEMSIPIYEITLHQRKKTAALDDEF